MHPQLLESSRGKQEAKYNCEKVQTKFPRGRLGNRSTSIAALPSRDVTQNLLSENISWPVHSREFLWYSDAGTQEYKAQSAKDLGTPVQLSLNF